MVLYVAPQSASSIRARRNLEALLPITMEGSIRLVVRDVAREPELAEADRVVFTPTLIVRMGEAVARVVGDLVDASAVTNMLDHGRTGEEGMTSTTTVAKIPTGVPGFDTISNGGIPKGRSTLVVGRAGTGKTILGLQIASHMAGLGIKTVLVAVEESPEDLVMTGDTLGLKLSEAIKDGRLRVTDASRPMDGPMVVTGDYDISGLTHRIEAIVKQTGAQAIVVDSATALFSPRPPQELLRSLFFQLIHSFKKMGLTSIVLAEAAEDYGQLTTLGVEDYVCDVVVILRNIIDGERRRRSIEINKYRRSPHYKGEYPCTITANGLNIFPLDAKDRPDSPPERYPSGLPGLDGMIEGGLFRDSIVIVRGPTGSGKTTLAGLVARSGRGARGAGGVLRLRGAEADPAAQLRLPGPADGRHGGLRQPAGPLPVSGGHGPRGSSRRVAAGPGGVQAVAGRARQHLLHRALVVGEGLPPVHGGPGVAAARARPQRAADPDRGGRRKRRPHRAVPVDARGHDPDPRLLHRQVRPQPHDARAQDARVVARHPSLPAAGPGRAAGGAAGVQARARNSARANGRPRAAAGRHALLLVEDFSDARETIRIGLQREGAMVNEAAQRRRGPRRRALDAVDAIVCDIGLPGEDGLSFMRKVRALPGAGHIPAAALTAWGWRRIARALSRPGSRPTSSSRRIPRPWPAWLPAFAPRAGSAALACGGA